MENQTQKPKKKFYKRWWFWVIVVFVIIIITSGGGDKNNAPTSTTEKNQLQTESTVAETKKQANNQKSYQNIFTFSGNGAKKSESFTIQGDRFKITYECGGDINATLCTAFVFKVGSNLPQAIMNSAQSVKDETIIYTSMAGKGEYYIDANVMGNFEMTVYDYK